MGAKIKTFLATIPYLIAIFPILLTYIIYCLAMWLFGIATASLFSIIVTALIVGGGIMGYKNFTKAPVVPEGVHVAIIGSGCGGMLAGIKLGWAGIPYTIFERGDKLGGTWRENTYPGAACDVPATQYCFSFEPNNRWTKTFAPQSEILEYLEHCGQKYGVTKNCKFDTEVTGATWLSDEKRWKVTVRDKSGEREVMANFLISSMGQLNRPNFPVVPEGDEFSGPKWHTAMWNHDVDLTDKTVAIIGNGASAIQVVPSIAEKVKDVYIFQRSPNWYLAQVFLSAYNILDMPNWFIKLTGKFKFILILLRWYNYWLAEAIWPMLRLGPSNEWLKTMCLNHMEAQLGDTTDHPGLREKIIPTYEVGCKRILITNKWIPTMKRDNVHLITNKVNKISKDSVITPKETIKPDVLIYATGFKALDFLSPISDKIKGRDQTLLQFWDDWPRAFHGVTVSGFPNFFMTYGPNTNLGTGSIIFNLECQTDYIMKCINTTHAKKAASLDVKINPFDAHNQKVQNDLNRMVWVGGCTSWYKKGGRVSNNLNSSCTRYWLSMQGPVSESEYHFEKQDDKPLS